MASHLLSKSSYLKGLQCDKGLYLYKHHYDWADEITDAQQQIFQRGHDVGKLAQSLFPGGADASLDDHSKSDEQVQLTKELINSGEKIIYEAAFLFDEVLVIADIIVKSRNGKWKIYEVKSSTEVKDVYLSDAAIQYYVISNLGFDIADISIIHINNRYVRQGGINVNELFNTESVKDHALVLQDSVQLDVERFKKVLAMKRIPKTDIGPYCFEPYDCSFYGYCWQHIPEYSVFNISGLKIDKKFDLYNQGIINIEDVSDDFPLSYKQRLQVEGHISNRPYINKKAIGEFLNTLSYPLYFLDFETIFPAIPLFDNSRPYQQIPFQFSLHYKESPASDIKHFEFLAEASGDPRIPFIENLIKVTKGKGDILVYNKAFESTRLKEIAENFPQHCRQIGKLLTRIKDLMIPFQKKNYYTPEMRGCYSIKFILPALVPDLSYDSLEISDGGTASRAFESLYFEKDEQRIKEIRKQLIKYCGMDTLAMVRIYEVLERFK